MKGTLSLLLACVLVTSTGCASEDEAFLTKLERHLRPALDKSTGYTVLRLDTLTNFDWDRLYAVRDDSGFDTDALISRAIGFAWKGPAIPNQSTRLLFVRQQEVVSYIDCTTWNRTDADGKPKRPALNIEIVDCNNEVADNQVAVRGLPRAQAIFAVYATNRSCEAGFTMIPVACLGKYPYLVNNVNCPSITVKIERQKVLMDSLAHAAH